MAASGIKPLIHSAEGLPEGVKIDTNSGWITDRAPLKTGDFGIALFAENSKGKSTKTLKLRV